MAADSPKQASEGESKVESVVFFILTLEVTLSFQQYPVGGPDQPHLVWGGNTTRVWAGVLARRIAWSLPFTVTEEENIDRVKYIV